MPHNIRISVIDQPTSTIEKIAEERDDSELAFEVRKIRDEIELVRREQASINKRFGR